jgi:hypothetical protein
MKKRINQGQSLQELAKGSLQYTLERIRTAFRAQFRSEDAYWNWYIVEVFADHIIVMDDQLPPDEFWRVAYQGQGDSYVFAARDAWELVELAYQSRTVQERRQQLAARGGQITLLERLDTGRIALLETEAGTPRRISARGMTANIVNNNNRRYRTPILEAAVAEAQTLIAERRLLAESNHPSDKPSGQADILESLIRWDRISCEHGEVLLEGEIIPTKGKGENLIILMEHGVYPRLSQRAHGKAQMAEADGQRFVDITELHITGYDLVMDPGDPTADTLVFENRQPGSHEEDPIIMDKLTLESLRTQYPDLVAQIEREHDERERTKLEEALLRKQQDDAAAKKLISEREASLRTQLGLTETDDLAEAIKRQASELTRLQEAEQARAVAQYIESECGQIKYADVLKPQFIERVKGAGAKTVEEAKAAIVAARKEYDAIQAGLELAARGHGSLHILGPVLERERGVPEFARASFALTESLIRGGHLQPRDLRTARNINERFTVDYLQRFDATYRQRLLQEARMFEEAEQASDLALPYSVSRALIAEALPELVALSIFDVQLVDPAPTTNIWFETYAGESGAVGTVTDEVVVGDHGNWVALANKRLQPGTVVLTNSGATTTYAEGSDYVVDYLGGRLMTLAAGATTDGQSLKIDYSYDAIRRGEMAAIKRGRNTLSSMALTIAADRLAAEISNEAIVFSRAALGYDARSRLLMRLIKQIQQKIDGGLFYLALAAALRVPSNSGGTWTAASDTVEALVQKIGVAKVKIANRNYEPTAVLMSKTNSDRLANWDGFTAAGMRPDADLTSAGYVGRVKSLPVFDTTNFTDSYILPINREIVLHRIGQPMALKGPFPSYSSGELVAAEQYYVEEFNGSEAPVAQKSAYVQVV